ncbi:MAG TPA: T9SS type A sorting domain-containing protein, partial [Chitinophagales bacterium]|nr:T9SS type A sorting domain-containing protein [Chitinophagales bacterium]
TSYSWSDGLGTNDAVTVTPTVNTIYSVVVTDANNCSATAEQTVTVNTLPVAAITGTASVCEGTSSALTATGGTSYDWSDALGTNDQVTVTPAATTTYSVTVTDANSCSNTATYTVTVLEHTSSQFSHTMCEGESYLFNGIDQVAAGSYTDTLVNANGCDSVITLVLTVNSLPQPTASNSGNVLTTESFTSYQWLLDGAAVNNGTTQSYTATANGNYSVVVTDANGCSDTSNVVNVTGLSIGAINAEAGIKLYPNPNNGRFALEFTTAADREIAISDVVGKVVYSAKANTQIVNVNAELPAGVYSVQVTRNKQVSTLKITVTK